MISADPMDAHTPKTVTSNAPSFHGRKHRHRRADDNAYPVSIENDTTLAASNSAQVRNPEEGPESVGEAIAYIRSISARATEDQAAWQDQFETWAAAHPRRRRLMFEKFLVEASPK